MSAENRAGDLDAPMVSVIVPCRNEEHFIGPCLRSILSNDYPASRIEVLVVDGNSDDGTRSCVEDFARGDSRVRLFENPKQITPAAMNIGVSQAHGAIIVRMDAHTTYSPDYIRASVAAMQRHNADVVGGVLHTRTLAHTPVARSIEFAMGHPVCVGDSPFRTVPTQPREVDAVPFGSFRREILRRVGEFDERLARSQDIDYWNRVRSAGGRIVLDPSIQATYFLQGRLGVFVRRNFLDGVWVSVPMRLSRTRFRPRHLVPLFAVIVGISMSFLGLIWWPGWIVLAALTAAYSALLVGVSIHAVYSRRDLGLLLVAPVIAVRHVAYGLGSLWGWLRPIQSYSEATGR